MTKQDFQKLPVSELRKLARRQSQRLCVTGAQIVAMRKSELVSILSGEKSITQIQEDKLVNVLSGKVRGYGNDGVSEDDIKAILQPELKKLEDMIGYGDRTALDIMEEELIHLRQEIHQKNDSTPRTVEISNVSTGKVKDIGLQHKLFPEVLDLVADRINVYLVGPAGSGKTYLAEAVADALDLSFYAVSVGLQTSKSDLIGYMSASGSYVSTMLREAYEHGGVYLMDELDAGNPNCLTIINAMTANSVAAFPDRMVHKHPDFVLMAAGNTYGRGGDRQYVGRNALDAATLDRFAVIDFDYDLDLERALCPDKKWCSRVQVIRECIFSLKEKVLCTPRASINGAKYIARKTANGMSREEAIIEAQDLFIFKGINKDIKQTVLKRAD